MKIICIKNKGDVIYEHFQKNKSIMDTFPSDDRLIEVYKLLGSDIYSFAKEYLCMYIDEKKDKEYVLNALPKVILDMYEKQQNNNKK